MELFHGLFVKSNTDLLDSCCFSCLVTTIGSTPVHAGPIPVHIPVELVSTVFTCLVLIKTKNNKYAQNINFPKFYFHERYNPK